MSDATLRELERRFQESGAVADHAALLRARLHAGDLTEDKLILAGYAGSDAARLALSLEPEPAPEDPRKWVSRLRFLLDYPAELITAAARLCAWLSTEWVWSRRAELPQPPDRSEADTARALALLARGWEFPTPALEEALEGLLPRYPSEPEDIIGEALDELFENPFAEGPLADLMPDPVLVAFRATAEACFPKRGTTGISRAADAASAAADVVEPGALRRSFERAVREWALGIARPDAAVLVEPPAAS